MSKYKAWIQNEISSYNNLIIGEMEIPSLGENEILVKTEASTLNYADLLLSSGLYQSNPEPPFVPGFEVAGTVVEAKIITMRPSGESKANPSSGSIERPFMMGTSPAQRC